MRRTPSMDSRRGAALSRVHTLEDEVRTLQRRLSELTGEVTRNDSLFRKTQERELDLLRARSLAELLGRLIHGLRRSYQLDGVRLILQDRDHEVRHLLESDGFALQELPELQFADVLTQLAPQLAQLEGPWLGPYRKAEHEPLLPPARQGGSLALLPLRRTGELDGVLVFSSADRFRFTQELASDFLAHLGVVAAICLENAVNRARLVRSGLTDFLTGFHNRRYLHARLCEELALAHRDRIPVACLMIDVDHFKRINDQYGHLAGDAVLREVAHRINTVMRLSDTGARFGGDEFAIVLPHGTLVDGERVAQRVLDAVRRTPVAVTEQAPETITLSIGVAGAAPRAGEKCDYGALAERLIAAADAALYRAKSAGRNQVGTAAEVIS